MRDLMAVIFRSGDYFSVEVFVAEHPLHSIFHFFHFQFFITMYTTPTAANDA